MNRLYLLSFLLTADRSLAEECFVRGLEDAVKGNRVFKEWAPSWARRTVIQNAIQMIEPRPGDSSASSSRRDGSLAATQPTEIAAIVELPAFERFAFVMSVLERYSDQECSLLLDRTRGEVIAARTRALQQLARSAELRGQRANISPDEQTLQQSAGSALQLQAVSRLAASA
ncbi:MAG: hypothetical protein WA655_01780 [Candidatus Korobacteraceae bacterium]